MIKAKDEIVYKINGKAEILKVNKLVEENTGWVNMTAKNKNMKLEVSHISHIHGFYRNNTNLIAVNGDLIFEY